MEDPREEIQIAAMFASGVGAELRDIDSKWEERSRKNIATQLDVRSIIKGVCSPDNSVRMPYDNPQPNQVSPIPIMPQARGDEPLPIPVEMGQDIMAGRIPQRVINPGIPTAGGYQQPPVVNIQPPVDDRQLTFELNLQAKDPKRIQTVNELTNHLEERLDIIESNIKMMLAFLVDIRKNTTRKYRRNTDETESDT